MKLRLPKVLAGERDSLKGAILAFGGASVLAAVALALQGSRYAAYSEGLEAAQRALAAVAAASSQIKVLEDELKADQGAGTDDVTFITQQATASNFGDVYPKAATKLPAKGYRDKVFTVTPPDKGKSYTRQQLATFFFRIEAMTSRMRVTAIDLRMADKKRPEEDLWTFSAEFTSRSREGE
ncbi:MAG TPA: hypothetical protein VFI25_20135 [Planctomycetota bacterium]|nr:hypothetical protein [Planctomycetota bacterium]